MRYFLGNEKALNIIFNKPSEYYAENTTEDIIEMIESEVTERSENGT
jgi:hypothetical protein